MNDTAPLRRIWLCADDYGLAEGVNRAIRDLIGRGRLNATSVMVVGPAIGRDEVAALKTVAAASPRCAIGLHATLSAPFRPLTMHFRPTDGGMFLAFPKLLRMGLLRRLDPEMIRAELLVQLATFKDMFGRAPDFVDGHQHVHVLAGVLVFIYMWLPVSKRVYQRNPEHLANRVEVAGLFWHFVDLVWIFVFPLFYLL